MSRGSLTKGTHTSQEKINNQIVVNPLQAALAIKHVSLRVMAKLLMMTLCRLIDWMH